MPLANISVSFLAAIGFAYLRILGSGMIVALL
jgi:hypothetical protein